MAETKIFTAPIKTDKMPPGIPYIVGNEAAERFNFYGLKAVLFVFMTQYLVDRSGALAPMSENEANKWFHVFVGTNYFFPILGAIISDVFLGKYRTIFWLSLVYCLGNVVLALDHTRTGLTVGLTLIAIGAGGIKPCVAAHVGDQFGTMNGHLIARAFGWFYLAVNVGSSVSIFLIPILLAKYGAGPAFILPAILMLLATFVFWSGRNKFAHIPPAGPEYLRSIFAPENVRILGGLAMIFVFMVPFWALWDQSSSEWVGQAGKMNLQLSVFGFGFTLLASQIQVVNAVLTVAFIPLFQYVVYPLIDKVWVLTPLRKMGLGIFTIGLSFLVSAWIESQIQAGVTLSIGWQVPAYVLLTAGEVMASITALEFAYTQAPQKLKSVVQALFYLSISGGNFFAAFVHWIIANPDGSTKLSGPAYYVFYAGLSIAASVIFVFFALRYRGKTYLQDEPTASAA